MFHAHHWTLLVSHLERTVTRRCQVTKDIAFKITAGRNLRTCIRSNVSRYAIIWSVNCICCCVTQHTLQNYLNFTTGKKHVLLKYAAGMCQLYYLMCGFGGLEVACWPLVPKFADSNPTEAVGEKILSTPSFGREVKPSVPFRRFTACKRSLNVTWKSGIFRQNSSAISRASSSSFHY